MFATSSSVPLYRGLLYTVPLSEGPLLVVLLYKCLYCGRFNDVPVVSRKLSTFKKKQDGLSSWIKTPPQFIVVTGVRCGERYPT